jgi:putative NADPH-quinone reductase
MKILYVYCHPLPESLHAALRVEALAGLQAAGHDIDLLDLYAEKFDPVLSEAGRRHYHDEPINQAGLEPIIARLKHAEAIVRA